MELNKEQIIKALECFHTRILNTKLAEKVTEGEMMAVIDAIELIKELTEENERLRGDVAKEFTCVFGTPHKVSDCPITDEIAKAKADTVRKIQKRLKAEMRNTAKYSFGGREYSVIGEAFIDQIAEEIINGN